MSHSHSAQKLLRMSNFGVSVCVRLYPDQDDTGLQGAQQITELE